MKYLYFQDFHISGRNSVNRLGNYFQDMLLKFDEILSIAEENDCDAIIDGGDLLHVKTPSYSVIDEIADRVEKKKISFYSLLGNHCMNSGHIENSKDTGLWHLQRRSEYFKYFSRIKYLGNQFKKYDIRGIEYKFGIEEELKEKEYIFEDSEAWNVLIIHALMTPKKFFENVSHLTPEQLKTNANLVLVAHYHIPYEKEVNNTKFLNIGCSGRLSISEAKIEPSVLLIDTETREIEKIKLKSAKKASEIFDLTKYEEKKENEKGIEDFIASLNSYEWQGMDIKTQIKQIAKEQEVDDKIMNYLMGKIEEIENE